ncbi:MAG: phenylalanine--tRNA ligase subunit beta [Gammaproteobacteria bacterium]|nr:phenylalanine--tRNA ligase subunit beta [Gammaproteobacteria bacterium]
MKFSERWLREWVDPPITSDALAEQLTLAGLEVESITKCQPGFTNVVVARVARVEKHPKSDNLSICDVDTGAGKTFLVVCGAPNVRVGGVYAYAPVGASLPGGKTLKQARIKGVDSEGMLCSAAELGLGDVDESILELDATSAPGWPLETCLRLNDQIIELSLTPNRGDCLSIRGVARDIAVINNIEIKQLPIPAVTPTIQHSRAVNLQAPAACPRYVGRVIADIDINRPSPLWLTEKLRRSEIRSINPVVDMTNYVMLELGQPLHAFDNDLLKGAITVRLAQRGEKLMMLDGNQVELTPDTLVIADDSRPVAMAGIMGGLDTGVTATTKNIFLESAYFTPEAIMGRSRLYGLHTDSSHRFERGVDFELQALVMERATNLILALCGGQAGPIVDIRDQAAQPKNRTIHLSARKILQILGVVIEPSQVSSILHRLGMVTIERADGWDIKIPSFRFDINLEADLVEEIARIYGYDRIPSAPIVAKLNIFRKNNSININELRNTLVNRGYNEVVTYSFVDADLQNHIIDEGERTISLLNPISSTMNVMRRSLWPGLVTTLVYNLKRQQLRARIFEYGRVFSHQDGTVRQDLTIGGLSYGNNYSIQWDKNNSLSNFYSLKGDIEALILRGDDVSAISYRTINHTALHPGQSAEIFYNNQRIGVCGALHPRLLQVLEIPMPVMVFELDCSAISMRQSRKYKKMSKFPTVRRDISILVAKELPVEKIMDTIKSASPTLLCNLELFDVYHGEGIDILKKSLALSLTFQASSNTLTDEAVEGEVRSILAALNSEFDSKLRE